MRVLVVDDSAAVRGRLLRLLRDTDGVERIAEAEDAKSALFAARALSPHLVILDLGLPDRSGLEVLPALKEQSPPPLVVVLSNHSGDAFAKRCRELGADYFFDKSTQFQLAIDVVRSHAARDSARPLERGRPSS